jgi:hypothetical protein
MRKAPLTDIFSRVDNLIETRDFSRDSAGSMVYPTDNGSSSPLLSSPTLLHSEAISDPHFASFGNVTNHLNNRHNSG